MNEECLICQAPLEYLEQDELMECSICHKKMLSKTRCVNGHFVCNECHMRGLDVIIGICGFWGACGAGISSGIFISIITGSTPLGGQNFGLANKMTAKSLDAIGTIGGPRCCKRDSFLSITEAVRFVKENFGVEMELPRIVCEYSHMNNQCIGKKCPFSWANARNQ